MGMAILAVVGGAWAKLPAPTEEAKAKAAEAAAKAAHAAKVEAYKLCLAQDRVAAHYHRSVKREYKPAAACADPGPYVPQAVVPSKDGPKS